jgi:hypothetical protein
VIVSMFLGDVVLARLYGYPVLSAAYRPAGAWLEPRSFWVPVPTKEIGIV